MTNNAKPIQISIADIFKNATYIVPIYQRNYAWEMPEIEQLMDDIISAEGEYCLGTLIVNEKEPNIYEVIDGQQRLTTLYLLKHYLKEKDVKNKEPLQFEARDKYRITLKNLDNSSDEFKVPELFEGYKNIKNCFNKNKSKISREDFINKLNNLLLIRVQVPKNIDLNHYFEIMNTRGEQLEPHQIAKANMLNELENEDKEIASVIFECCENMNSYVQMNFSKPKRNILFSDDWTDLKESINSWDDLKSALYSKDECKLPEWSTLKEILENNIYTDEKEKQEDAENERFEPIISYPNFLLQVNAVINNGANETSLDDKNFLEILKNNWTGEENVKKFIFTMLKCRILFDKYILKREYINEYQKTGRWSLKKLKRYNDKPLYISTMNNSEEDDNGTKRLRTLEAALRITYTSPKTMHWITIALKNLINDKNVNLTELLENYCLEKIEESDYKNKSGFDIERIAFSYLDYLLYRDGYEGVFSAYGNFEFQFRNSIEHFYPQNPDNGEKWDLKNLDNFGNMALITVSGNSKFSNMLPVAKIEYKEIIGQSLKLRIMAHDLVKNNKNWTKECMQKHGNEMMKILDNNGVN